MRAFHVILFIACGFVKGSQVEGSWVGGQCPANVTSLLQGKARKKKEPAPVAEHDDTMMKIDKTWHYDGDDVESKLSEFTQNLIEDKRGEKLSFPLEEADKLDRDVLNNIGQHIAQEVSIEGAVLRGCVHFVAELVLEGKKVADYGLEVDSFVAKCRTGVFVETQPDPVLLTDEFLAECDRAGENIRLMHGLMGPTSFDSPRRFCTVLVTSILPFESEPACMRFIEDINARVFLLGDRKNSPHWPDVMTEPHFDDAFMQACKSGEMYLMADDGACSDSLSALKDAGVTKPQDLGDLFSQVCPAVGLPLPQPKANVSLSQTGLRSRALLHFGDASKSHHKRSGSIDQKLQTRRDGHSIGIKEMMMDDTLLGKGGSPTRRRRRRRRALTDEQLTCCAEQAMTDEFYAEISAVNGISGSIGNSYGFNKWISDTQCEYKHSAIVTGCSTAGLDVGADVGYSTAVFYNYDDIPGCSQFFGVGLALVFSLGYDAIYSCNWSQTHIGHVINFGGGLGADISTGRCRTDFCQNGVCKKQGTSPQVETITFENSRTKDCNAGSCFPAGSTVQTPSGIKPIEDLRVGEKVLTVGGGGELNFEDVYFFGHADHEAEKSYIQLNFDATGKVAETSEMFISPDHFMVTCLRSQTQCEWSERVSRYAGSLSEGDFVWIHAAGSLRQARLQGKSVQTKLGMFNPYTMSGLIIVDGVVASAHSSWVLDPWTPSWFTHYLPQIYQALFLPGRILYAAVGPRAADWLDMNNPQGNPDSFGHGPKFLLGVFVAMAGAAVSALGFSKETVSPRLGLSLPELGLGGGCIGGTPHPACRVEALAFAVASGAQ